jgi:DNA adenine methylase
MTDDNFLFWDEEEDYKPIRAPFAWPGGKTRSVKFILDLLPASDIYAEPFGGSAAVMLAKPPSKLDVYNDRFTGVAAFYKCLADAKLFNALLERLEVGLHSREYFEWCKETWAQCEDDVERAARWYIMQRTSFGALGRNWGRNINPMVNTGNKYHRKLDLFPTIHQRMKNVQVENCDYKQIFSDYDSYDTVFYVDPPYLGTDLNIYKDKWSSQHQIELLKTIFNCNGFVALSGYDCKMNDLFPWDDKYEWNTAVSIKSTANNERNKKKTEYAREQATEVLWIKEAYADES